MVKDSGAPARTGAIKPLNAPQPISVRTDGEGRPAAVRMETPAAGRGLPPGAPRRGREPRVSRLRSLRSDGEWIAVAGVGNLWKINDEWWRGQREEIERVYYVLVLQNGQSVTVFHDMTTHEWHRQAD